ncbi:MAG TPA: SLBB domain-containing protein [Pyrinomonadaceae bacterium]|nr:SLBB domain-containing protein [Pyrinomonadaceae bacterium]
MQFRGLLIIFICLAAVSIGVSQTVPVEIATADAAQRGYVIGPGDEITGKVLGEPQFDFVATVDENGKIEIPFVDMSIDAKCLSERDLRVEVTKLLQKYLRNPQLSLRVTDRKSRPPVSLTGEVKQQQQITLVRRAHLLELISFAGGETERSGGVIQVYRTRPPICSGEAAIAQWKSEAGGALGVPSRTYSIANLKQGKEVANPEIFPGDVIVVLKAAPVYIVGEVVKPGEFGIPEEGLPLTQALAMASGITRTAKAKAIKIYRRKEGVSQPEVLTVDYNAIRKGELADPVLSPFDIVEVGKAPKKFTDYLIEFATGIPNRIPITY